MADLKVGFNTPFQEQIDFLRAKLRLPTERWDDIQRSAHDRAFIVAGAAKADLLADLHESLVRAATDGQGLDAWRKEFRQIVKDHGWEGWTGKGTKGGEAWRTRVIYQTNMATSYAAGRYKQLTEPSFLALRPFWRYIHSDSVMHPRPWHLAWHGLTLPHDHPFWQTHFPPNGWGCQCRVTAVSKREGAASARAGLGDPPEGWNAVDGKSGEPVGIDKGFGYAPGASVNKPMQAFIDAKLLNLDAPIGAAMWEALKPTLMVERTAAWQKLFDATLETMQAGANAVTVHTVAPSIVAVLATEHKVVLENSSVVMRDTELLHALRETKAARGATLPESAWRDLPAELEAAAAYLDTEDGSLIYAFDLGERAGKVVIRVNYNQKGRFDGVRARIVSNFIQTGGIVDRFNLTEARYVLLKK